MNHFLVTYVESPHLDVGITPHVFKLSHKCEPDDVTVPTRTLCFLFLTSNLLTAEAVMENIIGVGIGNLVTLIHSGDFQVESCLYCIGKERCDEHGNKWIYNPHTKTRMASALLWKDYKVIDM